MNDRDFSRVLYTDDSFGQLVLFFNMLNGDNIESDAQKLAGRLLDIAQKYGFDYNAWQGAIALLIITADNPFTRMCERQSVKDCTAVYFARRDADALFRLFNFDFLEFDRKLGWDCFERLENFKGGYAALPSLMQVSERLCDFVPRLQSCKTSDEFFDCICAFYRDYGVGDVGLNRSFHFSSVNGKIELQPIVSQRQVRLDDLIGYDSQKKLLLDNTEAFVHGRPSNNVLLYGDSGTGKSTSIKAIANAFYRDGLRMVEIYKHQIELFPALMSALEEMNYRFIIYLDDLSFEENETEYKYLKAVIEGGLRALPENVAVYATSNRRHLVRETWQDRGELSERADVHSNDTMEEKLSLASRFGLTIYYPKPSRAEYMSIVSALAKKNGIDIPAEQLENGARQWEMHHGGISGRTAAQYVSDLLGK